MSEASWWREKLLFYFFLSIFALTRLRICAIDMSSAVLSLLHFHAALLVYVLHAHLLLSLSCCGIHSFNFFHIRCLSNRQCSKNRYRAMCLPRNIMIYRETKKARDTVVQLRPECGQLIIHRYSSSLLSRPKKSETVWSTVKNESREGDNCGCVNRQWKYSTTRVLYVWGWHLTFSFKKKTKYFNNSWQCKPISWRHWDVFSV